MVSNRSYQRPSPSARAWADPQKTLDEWLDARKIAPFASRIARRQARSLFATDPDLIGVGFFAQSSGISNVTMRIRGGSSRLVNAMLSHLGERVHTGTPVRRIQQTDGTVTVTVKTANGLVEVMAHSVIVAIPWSVLRAGQSSFRGTYIVAFDLGNA